MRRRAFIAATVALTTLPAAAQQRAVPRRAPDMQRIFDRGRLVAAVAGFAVPPFVTLGADGALGGHDIALAEGMARALGLPVAFERAASFDAIIDSVASGTADLGLGRLSATLARAELVRFSRPYLVLHHALLVSRPRFARLARDGEPMATLKAGDAPLAIVPGTAAAEYARRLVAATRLRDYPRWDPDVVDAVRNGDVLAGCGDEVEVKRALAARPDAPLQLRAVVLPETRDPIAVALPWDSGQLLAWVDLYLDGAGPPPTVEQLLGQPEKGAE
ncbi:MAG TPA: transporter substrate-binding domain-containing protein [Stellaceae bacterium]|nr:transporter substrate-binding domain-containing protein [Stellaceae bacterium]